MALARPRGRTDAEVVACRERVLAALGAADEGARRRRDRARARAREPGSCSSISAGPTRSSCPRRTRWPVRCSTTARCYGPTSSPPHSRSCSGSPSRRRFGLGMAITLHFFDRTLRPSVYPLLIASQAVPIVLLAPVLVLWLGFGMLDKLVVIAIVSFFAFVVTTLAGLSSVRPRPDQADAHLRRHTGPDLSLRRAPGGAAGAAHRRQDRRRVRADRRRAGRAGRLELGPRASSCRRRSGSIWSPACGPPCSSWPRSPSACLPC